jgi:hypothetical protein
MFIARDGKTGALEGIANAPDRCHLGLARCKDRGKSSYARLFRFCCSSTKKPKSEAAIRTEPTMTADFGPMNIPMKKITTPAAQSSEPTRPAVFAIPIDLLIGKKYQNRNRATICSATIPKAARSDRHDGRR